MAYFDKILLNNASVAFRIGSARKASDRLALGTKNGGLGRRREVSASSGAPAKAS